MIDVLDEIEKRHENLNRLLSKPEIIANQSEFRKIAKEHAEINKTVEVYKDYKKILSEIDDHNHIISDENEDQELIDLARVELDDLNKQKEIKEKELKFLLIPKDPLDNKNVILEIRAGTGGEEASLFAADLFRMYSKYAEGKSWSVELMGRNTTGKGGLKEVIAIISGRNVYSSMKYESGTHRVQRVPETETSGRIHTSAATVAILPEAEEVDVKIDPNDIKVDIYRSSGPGGQSVNTTDSAVRITHIPTGIVVSMQDEKSQHKNKTKAMKILRARIMDKMQADQAEERSKTRKNQVGSGDRSERIRTYNFPQGRVTDHRINLTLYKLESILEGNMDEIIEKLAIANQGSIG